FQKGDTSGVDNKIERIQRSGFNRLSRDECIPD
ncbi:unnamed protein product, partial [marine sediment metagenome]